jgi:anaerobic selenocysteine-containing dehydrogenase
MTKKISRRDFLKLASGAVVLTGITPAVRKMVLEPYVQPPEEVLPGKANWYASTCRQCPAGCGIIVRVINGRAKKIEGNPLHPINQGKLCARGQAGLQVLYNPDRLRNAVSQTGGRGSREFEPIYWSQALDILTEKLETLSNPNRVAFLGGLMPSHLYVLATRLLNALGAKPPVIYDLHSALEGRRSAVSLSEALFGVPELPIYDLANAEVIFSFGANFLETWMSPVSQSHAYGVMRQGQFGGRGFLVQFEPRLSATAASADEWYPLKPGVEGYVALALGRIIVEERLGDPGVQQINSALYQNINVQEMADASQIPVEDLQRLARIFANADQAIAIPGGNLAGQSNGQTSMLAIQALNLLVAQFGKVGGVFLSQPGPTAAFRQTPSVDSFDQVSDLIAHMNSGDIDLLMIHGSNPVFELPAAAGFTEAIARVPYIISFNSFVDETAVLSDLLLPDHTYLESWGYEVPAPGAGKPTVSNQQPVVRPLYDTRSTGDIFLAVADRLGGEAAKALPWTDEAAFLEDLAVELHGSSLGAYDTKTTSSFWAAWRQFGGWWTEKDIPREPELSVIAEEPLPASEPVFDGEVDSFPFHLHPYPSIVLSDGRGANLPWLQGAPDPMTTASWGTWVELNPETAKKLGVENDDVVQVISPNGQLEAPVVIYPGIRPDVVAIPVGQGHSQFGRFAQQRGSNPIALVSTITDDENGSLAWGATRVRIEPTGRRKILARFESLAGEGRETIG